MAKAGVLQAYEYRSVANEADEVRYRLKGRDAVWPPLDRGYGGPAEAESWRDRAAVLGRLVLQLAVPVGLLVVLLGAAVLYCDALFNLNGTPAPIRDAGLGMSDLVLPGAWTCIHLTNRRHGPGRAFAQLLAGLLIGLAAILIDPGQIDEWASIPALTARGMGSFAAAFLIANFVAIMFFDAARGPRWWTAPLAASFVASFVFSAVYYPAAFAGLEQRWAGFALVHCAMFFGVSVALLMPYWLLRPATRPIGGMNGF